MLKTTLLITLGVALGIPIVTYFTIWWGVLAYHRAKSYLKQCDVRQESHNTKTS